MSCCPPPPRGREARAVPSTSEVYGKLSNGALTEHADRIYGETQKARWNYATSKSFGEALALGYHKELGADNVVVRLFWLALGEAAHTAWSCRASPARR